MADELKREDLDLILDSLDKSKLAVAASDKHPDYAFKRSQVEQYEKVIAKVQSIRSQTPPKLGAKRGQVV